MLHHTDHPDLTAAEAVPAGVAPLLAAAAAPPTAAELAGQEAAVAAFRATSSRTVTAARPRRVTARQGALAAAAAFGLLGASGAAAATGSLPDTAQDVARSALTRVGVDVPAGGGKGLTTAPGQLRADPASTPRQATPAKTKAESTGPAVDEADRTQPDNKGATISGLAHEDHASGAEKGAAVSDAASDGRSRAGEAQAATPKTAGPPASSPGVTAPGRATASTEGSRPDAPGAP